MALDTFIDNALHDPAIVTGAIESITPAMLEEWTSKEQFDPRPTYEHPIVFTVGFILVRGIDSKLYPNEPEKLQIELKDLKEKWEDADPNSDEKKNLELQIRLKRIAFIAKELGTLSAPLRYNSRNGL